MEQVKAQVKEQAQAQKNEHADVKTQEAKDKKKAAAKAFADRQKARKEGLLHLAENIKSAGLLDKLSADDKKFVEEVLAGPRTSSSGNNFFNKVFGDAPKVGDTIKLTDYFNKTFESKAKLDKAIKSWAEKGIVVEYKEAAKLADSTYTIKKLA